MITKMDPNWTRRCCRVKIKYSFRLWDNAGSMTIPMKATLSPWDAMKWHMESDMDDLIIALQEDLPEEERITFESMALKWDEENEMLIAIS